ncbi:MAG: hypothetical protein ACE5PO_08840 [Candidatus Bathyarchaeia archaeon]
MIPRSSSAPDEVARLQKLAYIMHAMFYGSIYAAVDENGIVDWEKIVSGVSRFMKCCKYLKPEYQDPDDIIADFERAGITQGAQVIREGHRLIVKIGECILAGGKEGVHRLICPIDVPCPLAFYIGANVALRSRPKKLMIQSTIFHEEGSTTVMELLPSQKYAQRKESIRLMKGLKK